STEITSRDPRSGRDVWVRMDPGESPRAAWRLDALGFGQVFDYAAGKADWGAAGLPREGRLAAERTAGDVADREVPVCALEDGLDGVGRRVGGSGWAQCVVVNEVGIVLGRLGRGALEADDGNTVEEAMSAGPGTVRPDEPLGPLLERLEQRDLRAA